MTTTPVLKKALFFSFIGHLALFSLFNFSFGQRLLKPDFNGVDFLGSLVLNSELTSRATGPVALGVGRLKPATQAVFVPPSPGPGTTVALDDFSKLPVVFSCIPEKPLVLPKSAPLVYVHKRDEPVITFYPRLPYGFLIYFKDRQEVHIELMFNITFVSGARSIAVKRKISSGNLEADLLTMRYISHYLFVEQQRFSPNNWQSVKIDLSPKDDQH